MHPGLDGGDGNIGVPPDEEHVFALLEVDCLSILDNVVLVDVNNMALPIGVDAWCGHDDSNAWEWRRQGF